MYDLVYGLLNKINLFALFLESYLSYANWHRLRYPQNYCKTRNFGWLHFGTRVY